MAVSYDNEQKTGEQQPTKLIGGKNNDRQETSFVQLYVHRESGRNPGIKLTSKDPYVKMDRIVLPLAEFQASAQLRSQLAVSQMDFSDNDNFLQLGSQKVTPDHIKDYQEGEDIFVVWDILLKQIISDYEKLKGVEWPNWSLSNAINARYQGNQIFPENPEEEKRLRIQEQCQMSAICRLGGADELDAAICGSIHGDLYMFRFPALYIDKNQVLEFSPEKVNKIDMSLTRGYSAHSSMVQCLEIFDRIVCSTSLSDQCIVQWKVEFEDQYWELDFNRFGTKPDPFGEVLKMEKYKILQNEIWNHRLDVAEAN